MKILQAVHTLTLAQYLNDCPSTKMYSVHIMTIQKMKVNDTIQLDLATNKVLDIIKFEASRLRIPVGLLMDQCCQLQVGNLCMVTGGANAGRVGSMISR